MATYEGIGCFRCGQTSHYADACSLPERIVEPAIAKQGLAQSFNLKGQKKNERGQPMEDVLYCGRPCFLGGWQLEGSPWQNKFKMTNPAFLEYVRHTPELLGQVGSLRGHRLACWCHPKPCHTNVLCELANA